MMQHHAANAMVHRDPSSPSRSNTRMALAGMKSVEPSEMENHRREEKEWMKRTLNSMKEECEVNLANSKLESLSKKESCLKLDSPRTDTMMSSPGPLHIQKAQQASQLNYLMSIKTEEVRHGSYGTSGRQESKAIGSDSGNSSTQDMRTVPRPRRASLGRRTSTGSKDRSEGGAWRRSFSKEPRIPSKTTRIPSKNSVKGANMNVSEDPNYLWETYLKHFTNEQLNWLSEYFEEFAQDSKGFISKEQAAHIATVWNEEHYECEHPAPAMKDVNAIILEVAKKPIDELAFDHLVFFVAKCEHRVLRADSRAGFSEKEVLRFKETFLLHCKGDENKNALTTRDIFEVLEDMGYDDLTMDQKLLIRGFIDEADVDKSGDIDLMEFLQLMRKVYVSQAEMDRQHEHEFIRESHFSDVEVDSYHDLYNHFANEDGTFSQMNLREVIRNLDIELDIERKKQLDQLMNSVVKGEKGDRRLRSKGQAGSNLTLLSFGEFLLLFRKMMDVDFGNMITISNQIVQNIEDEERYLSPEEFQEKRRLSLESEKQAQHTSSWVKRLILKKDEQRTRSHPRSSLSGELSLPEEA